MQGYTCRDVKGERKREYQLKKVKWGGNGRVGRKRRLTTAIEVQKGERSLSKVRRGPEKIESEARCLMTMASTCPRNEKRAKLIGRKGETCRQPKSAR